MLVPHCANSNPAAPPRTDNSTLSVSAFRMSRPRPAPSAARITNSWRPVNARMLRWRSKTRGHYADHRIRLSAQVNRVAHRMWIAAKVVLPEIVADHGETRPALHIFPGRNNPAQHRLHA